MRKKLLSCTTISTKLLYDMARYVVCISHKCVFLCTFFTLKSGFGVGSTHLIEKLVFGDYFWKVSLDPLIWQKSFFGGVAICHFCQNHLSHKCWTLNPFSHLIVIYMFHVIKNAILMLNVSHISIIIDSIDGELVVRVTLMQF